jgi:GNAT superfamily N-acetyltransferase
MLQFDRATQAQYEQILALYEDAIASLARDGIEIYWDLDHHPSRAFLRRAIERGELFVALRDGRVVGAFVMDANQRPEYDAIAWACRATSDEVRVMHVLAVHSSARGAGVGRFLLNAAKDECRRMGIRSLRLDALTCNAPACALYRSEGFLSVESRIIHIPDVGPHPFEVFEYAP